MMETTYTIIENGTKRQTTDPRVAASASRDGAIVTASTNRFDPEAGFHNAPSAWSK